MANPYPWKVLVDGKVMDDCETRESAEYYKSTYLGMENFSKRVKVKYLPKVISPVLP